MYIYIYIYIYIYRERERERERQREISIPTLLLLSQVLGDETRRADFIGALGLVILFDY